jgi:murein DD-endopeptidase MepM/ murein hydrolase activator NlpD
MDAEHPLGNHVVIQPAAGGHLFLAHLRQGSVSVSEGDELHEGQPVGACGNSGNSSEPHVHVHYQRQHPAERPLNFADGLPLYFRDHEGAAMPSGGLSERDGAIVATGDHVEHVGAR